MRWRYMKSCVHCKAGSCIVPYSALNKHSNFLHDYYTLQNSTRSWILISYPCGTQLLYNQYRSTSQFKKSPFFTYTILENHCLFLCINMCIYFVSIICSYFIYIFIFSVTGKSLKISISCLKKLILICTE